MSAVDQQLSAKVLKRVHQLRRLGPRGLVRTAYVRMLGPTVYSLADPCRSIARTLRRHHQSPQSILARRDLLERRARDEIRADRAPLLRDLDPEADASVASERVAGTELVLGRIRRDGAISWTRGPIRGVERTVGAQAPEENRSGPELVDLDGRLGVRRGFGADQAHFLRALETMLDLAAAGSAVPAVIGVDWAHNAVTAQFVHCTDEVGVQPSDEDRLALERALVAVHEAGYVLGRIEKNDVLWSPDRRPMLVGLHEAVSLEGLSRDMSAYLRDLDREAFNRIFGTRLMTAARLRRLPAPLSGSERNGSLPVYAPVVIRDDIRWGKIWNTDVGVGRWNFIMKEHLPIPRGGKVLDLGSNNGFNPLQMLRSGAASAVGVEIDAQAIAQGEFLKSAFEWLDNRSYDFRYIQGSQADLPAFGLPKFDVVTALCSLYYLGEREMRDLVNYIRTLTDVLVLQCNTDRLIDRSDEDTYRKASVAFAVELLDSAGFGARTVVAPTGYSRPLVIGRA